MILLAYEMRMADTENDKYTNHFFNLITKTNLNSLLKDLVLANKKDDETKELVWASTDRYKLMAGPDFRFVMKYKNESPYVILEE